jgi:hypothetical protein
MDNLNKIIKDATGIISQTHAVIDLININKNTMITLNDDTKNNLNVNICPIYYLFDNIIKDDIGCTVPVRNRVMEFTEAYTIFNIDKRNIVDISCGNHSTILYTFINKTRHYLYYSNSGLGVQNQPLYISNIKNIGMTCPKIYLVDVQHEIRICSAIKEISEWMYKRELNDLHQ